MALHVTCHCILIGMRRPLLPAGRRACVRETRSRGHGRTAPTVSLGWAHGSSRRHRKGAQHIVRWVGPPLPVPGCHTAGRWPVAAECGHRHVRACAASSAVCLNGLGTSSCSGTLPRGTVFQDTQRHCGSRPCGLHPGSPCSGQRRCPLLHEEEWLEELRAWAGAQHPVSSGLGGLSECAVSIRPSITIITKASLLFSSSPEGTEEKPPQTFCVLTHPLHAMLTLV